MARWTTGTCEANGIDIHYLRTGGGKPSVILLHGLMVNGACWTPLARALEEDYDVVMPDARGHGNSSAPDRGYSYDNLAADVVSLIEALGLATPVLLGHSMGGMTAAVVASRNPKRLRGLVLADPAFLTPQRQREVYESDIAAQHRRILNRPKEDFLAESRIRHSRRSREIIELFVQARFQTSIHAFEVLRPPNPDYVQLINTLPIPSLLVVGDVGAVVSPEMAAELVSDSINSLKSLTHLYPDELRARAQQLDASCCRAPHFAPRANLGANTCTNLLNQTLARLNQRLEIVQIAEAGHAVPFDQPERFSAVVKTFLRSLSV